MAHEIATTAANPHPALATFPRKREKGVSGRSAELAGAVMKGAGRSLSRLRERVGVRVIRGA